jgi:hypothetical protein
VLEGTISLGTAFRAARPPQLPAQEKSDGAVSAKAPPRDRAAPRKTMPSLPTLKSMRSPAGEIDRTELREFLQIFAAPEEP